MKKRWKILTAVLLVLAAAAVIAVPYLLNYKEDGSEWYPKPPAVESGRKHIVCAGDSIMYGAGVEETRDTESWPAFLQKKVSDDWQVLNYGLSGRTMLHDGDAPYVKERFYRRILKADAEICIIMLGTNDSKKTNWEGHAEAFRQDYLNFIAAYRRKHPDTEIILMQPTRSFPMKNSRESVFGIRNDVIQGEICGIVAEVAEEAGCGLINLYSLTEDHPEWFTDGVHPNAEGNRQIADYIYEQIRDRL